MSKPMSRTEAGFLVGALRPQLLCPESDAVLLARFLGDRDEPAFTELMRRHGPMVLAVGTRIVRDQGTAEDVLQAAFVLLARKAHRLRNTEAVGAWLHRVTVRLAHKIRHRNESRQQHESRFAAATGARVAADPGPAADLREDLAILDEEIARLPERHRSVVVLCLLEGMTQEAAAARVGRPLNTVRTWLRRSRQRLAARLVRRGVCAGTLLGVGTAGTGARAAVLATTLRAAAEESPTTAGVSAGAAELVRETLREMTMWNVKWASAVLVLGALGGLVLGIASALPGGPGADAIPRASAPVPRTKPLAMDDEVVKAWTAAGFKVKLSGPVPVFQGLWIRRIGKLPPPQVPFALDIAIHDPATWVDGGDKELTDDGLKELARFQNLILLNLAGTKVTDAGLKELSALKNLTALNLDDTLVTPAGVKELSVLKNLTKLNLGSGMSGDPPKVTDAGLKELANCEKLTELNLCFDKVTEVGLKELAKCKSLTALNLSYSGVTDAGLKEIARREKLERLTFYGNSDVTDAGLKELAKLDRLTTLDLAWGKNGVTDAGVKELAALKNLTTLDLRETQLTDAGFKDLTGLKNLTALRVGWNPKVTDAGLKEIARLKSLTTLDLWGTSLTDAGLKDLATLPNLTTLNLGRTKVTGAGLKELATLKNLTTLDVWDNQLTDADFTELAALEHLTTLTARDVLATDAGLKDLVRLKNLTTLDLGAPEVTDTGLKELATLKNLTQLTLCAPLTDAGLKEITKHNNLTQLTLRRTQVTDAGLKELANLKGLTYLMLIDTGVTDAGLKDLATLKNLTEIRFIGCNSLTDVGLKELRQALPTCRVFKQKGRG